MKEVLANKVFVFITVSIVLASTGLFFWRGYEEQTRAAKLETEILKGLTEEEIFLVLNSEAQLNPQSITVMKESAEKRQKFLNGIREYLALAAEARRVGLNENVNFKINVEYKKNILLAEMYRAKLGRDQGKIYAFSDEEIKSVWADSQNEVFFDRDMKTLKEIQKATAVSIGNQPSVSELSGESLTKARENWAQTKILSDKAKADVEFMNLPEISLRLKIVEAGILASDYLRTNWSQRIKATDEEIKNYLALHPEYDVRKKQQTAEMVLQKVKNGEDFARLAKEFSEDRGSKNNGGLYENVSKNILWQEVEAIALKLKKGQIADQLIESNLGYHIVKLEDRKIEKNKDGSESVKFSVRHIVLQKNFEEPGVHNPDIPPPFMKAEEIAKTEVEKVKRAKFIAEIEERNPVFLPKDFSI